MPLARKCLVQSRPVVVVPERILSTGKQQFWGEGLADDRFETCARELHRSEAVVLVRMYSSTYEVK